MNAYNIVLAIILVGFILVGVFVLGMLLAVRLLTDAQDDARYDRLKEEYYRLAGYRNPGDPMPYCPPKSVVIPSRKLPRKTMLPHMNTLDRRMREGKRGTILWRAGDRQKAC